MKPSSFYNRKVMIMNIAFLVREYVDSCKEREPIFVRNINVADINKNARDMEFHRLAKEGTIKRYKKGIYYKVKQTRFGELGIDKEELIIRKYIRNNNDIIGYITGPTIWNNWGLTTQVPNKKWIVTNVTKKNVHINDIRVKLIRPKIMVNSENYKLLQLLDVVNQMDYIQDIIWREFPNILINQINRFNEDELKQLIYLSNNYKKKVNDLICALIIKADTKER